MKLFLTSAYDHHPMLDRLEELASLDKIGRHELADSAESADAILFVENAHFDDYLYQRLRRHPFLRQFPDKVFMYNEVDKPWCALPGLYCSMPSRLFHHKRQIAFPYLFTPNRFVPYIHQWQVEKRWLFSFVGSVSHRVRKDVIALADVCPGVKDTSEFNVWDSDESERVSQGMAFAEALACSHFMLCPRGIGTSSFRVFEAMQAQRAPVVISDHWVEPPHVDWDFLVRVKEKDIKQIPELLKSMLGEADDRAKAARDAWELAYAPDVLFDTAAESIGYLCEARRLQQQSGRWQGIRKFLIQSEVRTLETVRRLRDQLLQASP